MCQSWQVPKVPRNPNDPLKASSDPLRIQGARSRSPGDRSRKIPHSDDPILENPGLASGDRLHFPGSPVKPRLTQCRGGTTFCWATIVADHTRASHLAGTMFLLIFPKIRIVKFVRSQNQSELRAGIARKREETESIIDKIMVVL